MCVVTVVVLIDVNNRLIIGTYDHESLRLLFAVVPVIQLVVHNRLLV